MMAQALNFAHKLGLRYPYGVAPLRHKLQKTYRYLKFNLQITVQNEACESSPDIFGARQTSAKFGRLFPRVNPVIKPI